MSELPRSHDLEPDVSDAERVEQIRKLVKELGDVHLKEAIMAALETATAPAESEDNPLSLSDETVARSPEKESAILEQLSTILNSESESGQKIDDLATFALATPESTEESNEELNKLMEGLKEFSSDYLPKLKVALIILKSEPDLENKEPSLELKDALKSFGRLAPFLAEKFRLNESRSPECKIVVDQIRKLIREHFLSEFDAYHITTGRIIPGTHFSPGYLASTSTKIPTPTPGQNGKIGRAYRFPVVTRIGGKVLLPGLADPYEYVPSEST